MVLTRSEALRQPILDPDVELELIRAYREEGDEMALDAISRSYARLCYSIASQYTKDEHRMEDLAQEGNFGIRRAVEKYDPARGTKFSTYSRRWVQNYVGAATSATLNDITVPPRAYMDAKMGRLEEGVNDRAVFAAMPFMMLDAPISDAEGSSSSIDLHVRDDETPECIHIREDQHAAMRRIIGAAVRGLNEREANVLVRRKLQEVPDTLEEISEDFGVTRERIRQIEVGAMLKVRDFLTKSGFNAKTFFQD